MIRWNNCFSPTLPGAAMAPGSVVVCGASGSSERLIAEDRIDHMAAADYRPGSLLTIIVKGILGRMARHAAG